jgi:hypothetical protein
MPGRLDIEEKSAGATALKALGNGCLMAAGALLIVAICGLSPAIGLGSVAVASWLGMGCWLGADALQNTALLAAAERKRRAEEEQYREDAATDAFCREVADRGSAQAPAEPPQEERTRHFVALIERRRENEADAGRCV